MLPEVFLSYGGFAEVLVISVVLGGRGVNAKLK